MAATTGRDLRSIQKLVGGPGFEPGASRSRTVRAAKLRQPPTSSDSIGALLKTPIKQTCLNCAPDFE